MIPIKIKHQAKRNIRVAGKAAIKLMPRDTSTDYIILLAEQMLEQAHRLRVSIRKS